MSYFLGIDLGASSLKASLIDAQARQLGVASAAIASHNPAPGQVEQNPADWLRALVRALANLKQSHGQAFAQIDAISFSGGAHIGVLLDADGEVLRPAIMWSDQRAGQQAQALQKENREASTANRPNPTWTLPQLIWLQTHEGQLMQKVARLTFAKDWLRAQLTQDWQTDISEAVGAMLANYPSATWSEALLHRAGLTRDQVPPLVDMQASAGVVTPQASALTGLKAGIAVYQGAIDTTVEWLCCSPLSNQTASLKLASAGVLAFGDTKATSFSPVSLYPHILPDTHYHAAGMNNCTGALHWMRQLYLADISLDDMQNLARSAPLGSRGVVFYPYLNGERAPLWDPSRTASLQGLTRGTDQASLARAAYEGIGHALTEIFNDMVRKLGRKPEHLHILGGGAQSPFWAQMLADMMDVTLTSAQQTDASFAAALLAMGAHHRTANVADMAEAGYQPGVHFAPDKARHIDYVRCHSEFLARRANP
jgi:xylulokinase